MAGRDDVGRRAEDLRAREDGERRRQLVCVDPMMRENEYRVRAGWHHFSTFASEADMATVA
jgi:hypothetical protein